MSVRFRQLREYLAPSWLTARDGLLVGYSLDLIADAFVERVRLGLLARLPQNDSTGATTAPDDALSAIGRDRRVVRGIGETSAKYALRLIAWLNDRKSCGNPFTLMRQLAGYTGAGVSFRTVDVAGNWYSRDVNGVETSSIATGNWNWDGNTAAWSRFWVIVYPGSLWSAESGTFGDGALFGDTTATLGLTATSEHIAKLRFLVDDWRPAGTQGEIVFALDPASFNPSSPEPDGLWRAFYKYVTGAAVASRLSTARYVGTF